MFDTIELPADDPLHRADDAAVVAAMQAWARVEAQAAARRLAAIAELTVRRCEDGERAEWSCDDWDGAAAEVSAALGVSHGRASGQMHEAMALRTRLPKVAALFAAGALSARVVAAIAWRTNLVVDAAVADEIDAALALAATGWDRLSQYKMDQAIDAVVDRHDPGAVHQSRASARSRDVVVGGQNPKTGTTAMWGRLLNTDATVLDRRLSMMAHQVCDDDPRTTEQRRADALGALAAGSTVLACQCGAPACPAATVDARAGAVVIHVLADAAATEAAPDPLMSGEPPSQEADGAPGAAGTAVIAGGPAVPPGLLGQLIAAGAKVRPMGEIPCSAGPSEGGEPQYRPSTALDEFIRMRDLTCRFPNCDVPANHCDIDHRTPWPAGPTHPSNLRALCRKHHLLRSTAVPTAGVTPNCPTAPLSGPPRPDTPTPPSPAPSCGSRPGTPPAHRSRTTRRPSSRSTITPTALLPCPGVGAPVPPTAPTGSDANVPSTTPASPNATGPRRSDRPLCRTR